MPTSEILVTTDKELKTQATQALADLGGWEGQIEIAEVFYQEFDESLQELNAIKQGKQTAELSLSELINDLEN